MPQKILIATILRPAGDTGVQSHFRAFLSWLNKKESPVSLVTPYNCPRWQVYPIFALRRLIDPISKPASVWWYRFWHQFFLQRALHFALADSQACTVYAQCPLSAAAALSARKTPEQKVVMVVHFNISQADEWSGKGMIQEGDSAYRGIRNFEAHILPRLDGLVFVSDFMRREVVSRIPATVDVPYRIIPNFLADPGNATTPPQATTDLICIGTLEPRKNQRYALEIIAAAARAGRSLSLTIVGDGPDRSMLESLASELNIKENVVFAGFMRSAANLIPTHFACLHTAQIENLPLTLIEALSRSVPVFAPAVGGIPEVFVDGSEGRLIPLDNADTAAQLIIDWLGNPDTMTKVRLAARQRFLARFEAEMVAANLLDFLCSTADFKTQPYDQSQENIAA